MSSSGMHLLAMLALQHLWQGAMLLGMVWLVVTVQPRLGAQCGPGSGCVHWHSPLFCHLQCCCQVTPQHYPAMPLLRSLNTMSRWCYPVGGRRLISAPRMRGRSGACGKQVLASSWSEFGCSAWFGASGVCSRDGTAHAGCIGKAHAHTT